MSKQNPIPARLNLAPRGRSWLAGKLVDGHDGHISWQDMQIHARETLVAHAEGRVHHISVGNCPDEIEGHDKRDTECPVCQALMAVEAP